MIVDKKFNHLLVLEEVNKNGRIYCKCKCDCGNIVNVSKSNLQTKHTTSCGCINKNKEYENLVDRRFGRLIVLEKIECKDKNGHHHYLCKCDCGNIVEVLGVNLLYNQTTSCGCNKKISALKQKISKTNKSGIKGVYFDNSRQKWVAKLTINRITYKSYHLSFKKAVKARKAYEEKYHKPIIDKYLNS